MIFPFRFIGVEPGWPQLVLPCTFEWDENKVSRSEKNSISELLDKRYSHQLLVDESLWYSPNWFFIPKVEKIYQLPIPFWNGICFQIFVLQGNPLIFLRHNFV